jgi:hypothetical protein
LVVDLSTWPGEARSFHNEFAGADPTRVSQEMRRYQFVIPPFRTAVVAAPTNLHRQKEVAMKHVVIKRIAVVAALVVSSAANAANYDYTENYVYIRKPMIASAQRAAQLQEHTVTCNNAFGMHYGMPSASYRSCMLQHGWKFSSLTRTRIQAVPADPYFSSNAKVAPGHFIDHDNGMGAEVCDPPDGTVHYFDPDQNLPCTRTGAMSICSNM